MNRYLVLSDLHLCDIEDNPDGWKDYKSSRYVFDRELAILVEQSVRARPDGSTFTLVLNGDIFDFDLVADIPPDPPWPVSISERKRGLDPTPGKSAWKLQHILDQHPGFLEMLSGLILAGHRIVIVMGNHDRELHFKEVWAVLVAAVRERVEASGGSFDPTLLCFEPWFHLVPGEIYVEHGNQYDYYSSFRHLLCPTVHFRDGPRLALPMGNLSNRYLLTRMGFFNPHASDFILNLFSYVWHWFRHYAFTRRSIVWVWFVGSFAVMARLIRIRRILLQNPPDCDGPIREEARRKELPVETVGALARLHQPPITSRFFRIVREFWVDRLFIALGMVAGTVALALVPIPLWIKLMVPLTGFPLAFFIYESLARGEDIFTIERMLPRYARAVARIVPVRLVTFGHTHVPVLTPLSRDTTYADTGTWAPITHRWKGGLRGGYRNYVLADITPDDAQISLGSWMELEPDAVQSASGISEP
jgi:UDP-2,3-diacylglucosamine pyrophosphatase LpxH